jgi:flagellar FliL protein
MNKTMAIILAIALLGLGALGGSLYMKMTGSNDADSGKMADTVSYSPGDAFITNLKGSKQLLKAAIVIEMDSNKEIAYMTKHNYKIRDLIIENLSGLTAEDMMKNDIRDTLKTRIRKNLEDTLAVKGIVEIYFDEFVTQ